MKTIQAPDGYYYKKDSIYTTEINLPDGFSEEGWELVTEAEYQAFKEEQERLMLLQDPHYAEMEKFAYEAALAESEEVEPTKPIEQ